MLDLIEAYLEGRLVDGIESHSIGGTQINLIPTERLVTLRDRYRQEVANEDAAARAAAGLSTRRTIRVRFGSP